MAHTHVTAATQFVERTESARLLLRARALFTKAHK